MTTDAPPEPEPARWIPYGLVGLGAAFVVTQTGVQLLIGGVASLLAFGGSLSVFLAGFFSIPIIGGGLWLQRSDIDPDRYRRVAGWCVGLLVVVLVINFLMIAAWPAATTGQNVAWAVQAAQMGAAGGVLFGSIEARAIERARAAERARVRSIQLEAQREWLDYLNGLLRHEVLNTANVVVGYAEMVLEESEDDDRSRERVERIARQSRKMTDVIQDVQLLIQATDGEAQPEPVDVVDVLEEEVSALEDRYEAVSVGLDAPEQALVTADELVSRVFSNVLANAVEHSDDDLPAVHVSVEVHPASVTVEFADDGPGVPEEKLDSLFQRSGRGNHGLGLYLARTLLARYRGTIELRETGPDGSVFVVELPRATPEPGDSGSTNAGAATADIV